MPEYLAPGVYVEETSFRAKPIEGVSTSTTGFAGATRKGPVTGVPELITSFGEFERIFGGFAPLDFQGAGEVQAWLAHAVRGYFENGGSRLYVARAYTAAGGTGIAQSDLLLVQAGTEIRFLARFPGAVGNGTVRTTERASSATWRTLDSAPQGSVAVVGAGDPARPAALQGGFPPFRVANNGVLRLDLGGGPQDLTFTGTRAERTGAAVANPVNIVAGDNDTLQVALNGLNQTVTFAAGAQTPQALVNALNLQLRGGSAELTGADEIILRSEIQGTAGSVQVLVPNGDLGFAAADAVAIRGTGVADLDAVGPDDINALIAAVPALAGNVAASLDADSRRLRLATTATGAAASLEVLAAPANSAHGALGLAPAAVNGSNGGALTVYEKRGNSWFDAGNAVLARGPADLTPPGGARLVTLTVEATDADGRVYVFDGLGYAATHPRSARQVLAETPARAQDALENLFALRVLGAAVTTFDLRTALVGTGTGRLVTLAGGSDGVEPATEAWREALRRLADVEGISIIAGPGASFISDEADPAVMTRVRAVRDLLITHVENDTRYRIAVLDTPQDRTVGTAQEWRGSIDSRYAALYHPWLMVANPLARPGNANIPAEIGVPPSGHVCGIYARNDSERGVHKAPANEVVRGIVRFATNINHAQQEVLNPAGVNCFRPFSGRGLRLWGARLASSDGEWKYVSDRRYFNYLEASIDRGTQWAVFEPNGEALWADIRQAVSEFLYNEWRGGALLGSAPEQAFFVRCDRSTMTQNDLDNGRLICEIGVAVLKPAEFVIFRIGQKTADAT